MAAVARHAAAVRQAPDQADVFASPVCLSSCWRPPSLVVMPGGDRWAGNVNLLVVLLRGRRGLGAREKRDTAVRNDFCCCSRDRGRISMGR